MNSDDQSRELSPAEKELCELWLKYDELQAVDRARDDSVAPENRSPDFAKQLNQGFDVIDLLNEAFTPPPSHPDLGPQANIPNALAESSIASAPLPRAVGHFNILRVLGYGGIGIVYLAYDLKLGRRVALKIPRPETMNSLAQRRRFLREAMAAGRLCHQGIVSVYEAGEEGPTCYIAAEYCEGPTLAAWLAAHPQPLPPRQAARLVTRLADAVQHAHSRGVLHRDIKPTNVLLELRPAPGGGQDATATGSELVPKLGDFGMAKLLECEESQSLSGMIIGTPEYMSPEQAQGRTQDLSATTDVYALGVLLYQILTGQVPFKGVNFASTLHRVVYEEPCAPRRICAAIPPDLEAICLKCMAKLPEERYATASELSADLVHFLKGEPTSARVLNPLQRLSKWARRRPAIATLAGLLALLTVAVFAAALLFNRELRLSYEHVALAQHELQQQLKVNNRALWASDVARAWEGIQKNRGDGIRLFFKTYDQPSDETLQRSFAGELLRRHFAADNRVLYRHEGPVHVVEYSPDGRYITTAGADGRIQYYDLAGGEALAIPRDGRAHSDEINTLSFSPDGSYLASAGDDGVVKIWDWVTGTLSAELDLGNAPPHKVFDVAYSPDGALLAAATRGGAVRLFTTVDFQELDTSPLQHPDTVVDVAFSDDGVSLATASDDGHVRVWSVPSGSLARDWRAGPSKCSALAFAHRGQLLVSADQQNPAIRFWDPVGGRAIRRLEFGDTWIHTLAFSHDDRWLAFSNKDGAVGLFDLVHGQFGPTVFTDAGCLWSVRFSPDSSELLLGCGDGTVRLVSRLAAMTREGERMLPVVGSAVAFLPTAGQIAIHREEGLLQKWDSGVVKLLDETSTQPYSASQVLVAAAPHSGIVAFARDGCRTLVIADLESGRQRKIAGFSNVVMSLQFSSDGSRLATGHDGGELCVWDVASGALLESTQTQLKSIYAVGFAANDAQIATAGNNRLCLWDAQSLEPRARPIVLVGEAYRMAIQPGGPLIASNDDDLLLLWDTSTHDLKRLPAHNGVISTLSFSPDGQMLISGGNDGTLWLWDVPSRRKLLALASGLLRIPCAVFSDDGNSLMASLVPRQGAPRIKVWNVGDIEGSQNKRTLPVDLFHDGSPLSAGARRMRLSEPLANESLSTYWNDFDSLERCHPGVSAKMAGGARCAAEDFAGQGGPDHAIAGQMLRACGGETIQVELANLPPHTSIDINFMLAVIDSWDGAQARIDETDAFDVRVDGVSVFRESFCNLANRGGQFYVPSAEVSPLGTAVVENRGFDKCPDAVYDMRYERAFERIPHTAATLTVEWRAMRPESAHPTDESWALDNLEIVIHCGSQDEETAE